MGCYQNDMQREKGMKGLILILINVATERPQKKQLSFWLFRFRLSTSTAIFIMNGPQQTACLAGAIANKNGQDLHPHMLNAELIHR